MDYRGYWIEKVTTPTGWSETPYYRLLDKRVPGQVREILARDDNITILMRTVDARITGSV